jgi:hypothetical protein
VLPKTLLGKAIGYALNNWAALCRYLEQGYLAIDNNLSERTLRQIALGRNNWGVLAVQRYGQTHSETEVQSCTRLLQLLSRTAVQYLWFVASERNSKSERAINTGACFSVALYS